MSTFIEFEPINDSEKVSVYVRIDNDFAFTVVYREAGVLHTTYYNVQGIPDDYLYEPDPPDENLVQAQLVKDGAGESLIVKIKMFYNASDNTLEPHEIPRAWVYGEEINKDHYLPGTLVESISQSFPDVIWSRLTPSETEPVANSQAAVRFDRRYDRLGTLSERRTILKHRLRDIVFSNSMPMWMIGAFDINHQQSFGHWLEMMARTISIDGNFDSEAKFNLLYGDLHLDPYELASKMSNTGIIGSSGALNSNTRSAWTGYVRFGSVASGSPFTYTAPTGTTWTGSTSNVAGLTLTGVPSVISENNGRGWLEWLRE